MKRTIYTLPPSFYLTSLISLFYSLYITINYPAPLIGLILFFFISIGILQAKITTLANTEKEYKEMNTVFPWIVISFIILSKLILGYTLG